MGVALENFSLKGEVSSKKKKFKIILCLDVFG